jgi:hypothetical protein
MAMKTPYYFLLVLLAFLLNACIGEKRFYNEHQEFHLASVNNNVCKTLEGNVVLYAIFVDSKYTNPWTKHDIRSTIDSISEATKWIEKQAKLEGIPLTIDIDFHQNENEVIPIEGNLIRKTLSKTVLSSNGVKNVDRWADQIGNKTLRTFPADTTKITLTKIKPKDRERLIAKLRDKHETDNVALIYFINNYYTDEISVALHTQSDTEIEYAIVSFKNPSVIAHEFLHLFGAWDLYLDPLGDKKKAMKRKAFVLQEFPNEIMAFTHRPLDSLNISPFTDYLIGWDNELDENYKKMILGNKIKVAKY